MNHLGGYADSGDFIADRPGFIQVCERGAERVTVEPLTGGGTINLSLNVNGSLAGISRSEMEVLRKGNSVRRVNASQARTGL